VVDVEGTNVQVGKLSSSHLGAVIRLNVDGSWLGGELVGIRHTLSTDGAKETELTVGGRPIRRDGHV
jgi:hypothetical protein